MDYPETALSAAGPLSSRAAPTVEARRRATQLTLDFILRRLDLGRRLFDDDLVTTLVFIAITQGNVGYVDEDEALYARWSGLNEPPPDEMRRPMSGYAAALKLGLPRETVRRKIKALLERDLLRAADGGYYSPADALAGPQMTDFTRESFVAARDYFLAMADLGLVDEDLMAVAERGPQLPRMASRALNNFVPTALEPMQRLAGGELTTGVVFCAVAAANLAGGSGLGGAGQGRGRPISALALAARVGMPRETTRRHVRHLIELGLVEPGRRGLVIPEAVMNGPKTQAAFERAWTHRAAFVRRLALAGVLSTKVATSKPAERADASAA